MAILQEAHPSISIIIVNYNTPDLTLKLINHLGTSNDTEILVVDNSLKDDIQNSLPKHVLYFFMNKNIGFAGANNFGILKSHGKWICLLNSDAITSVSDIEKLKDITEKKGYLVSAPKLIGEHGKVQDTAGYFESFFENPINNLFLRPHFLKCSLLNDETEVDVLTGAALLIYHTVFEKIGYLDHEHYFMYFEDMDFCYQLYKKKISLLYVPQVTLFHWGGGSSNIDKNKKNTNYQIALNNYLRKNRGVMIMFINIFLKFLR